MSDQNQLQGELGYELRSTAQKGQGIFATKDFKRNELVMLGGVLHVLEMNTAWATQVGVDR